MEALQKISGNPDFKKNFDEIAYFSPSLQEEMNSALAEFEKDPAMSAMFVDAAKGDAEAFMEHDPDKRLALLYRLSFLHPLLPTKQLIEALEEDEDEYDDGDEESEESETSTQKNQRSMQDEAIRQHKKEKAKSLLEEDDDKDGGEDDEENEDEYGDQDEDHDSPHQEQDSSFLGLSPRMIKALSALSNNPQLAQLYKNIEEHGLLGQVAAVLREFDKDPKMSTFIDNIAKDGLEGFEKADPSLKKSILDLISKVDPKQKTQDVEDKAIRSHQ
jgi:hypothetical protein